MQCRRAICTGTGCRHRLEGDAAGLCVLDVAEACGPLSLAAVGALFGLTRERIRQIETKARDKVRLRLAAIGVDGDSWEHRASHASAVQGRVIGIRVAGELTTAEREERRRVSEVLREFQRQLSERGSL